MVETLRWINSNVTGQEKDGNMRPPPRGMREEDYRQWAGHEITLEIEDVLDKKQNKNAVNLNILISFFSAHQIFALPHLQSDKLSA